MISTLILDWAGTIADDLRATHAATNQTMVGFGGAAIDLETYVRDFRIPVMEFYESRVPGRTLDELNAAFEAHFRAADQGSLFADVDFLLHLARHHGIVVHVVSTLPRSVICDRLEREGLGRFIAEVHGDVVDKRKYLADFVAKRRLEPGATLYVGDTRHDVEAAQAAGLRAGAALYGYTPAERLIELQPDYCFQNVRELCDLVERECVLAASPLVLATVGGLISDAQGRVLLTKTSKWSDLFGVPGGKIEYGEPMLDAYTREIVEEVNLRVADTQFVMLQDSIESPDFHQRRHFLLINFYSVALNPEELRVNYEISEARWVAPSAALSLPLNRPTRILLQEAGRRGLIDLGTRS